MDADGSDIECSQDGCSKSQGTQLPLGHAAFKTCYQPHPAYGGRGPDVAHTVDNSDPNPSVTGELLMRAISHEEWPGRGPVCHSCAEALGVAFRRSGSHP